MARRPAARAALERRLGHRFARPELLDEALTHASVAAAADNERLEFLGDRVLGLLAAEALVEAAPSLDQGELSRRHAALVSGPACAAVARRLEMGAALRLGGGRGLRDNDRVLGDGMEAVIAAIYRDAGLEAARRVFQTLWADELATIVERDAKDPKSALQEWAMARGLPLPAYRELGRGPENAPAFEVEVLVEGAPPARGAGRNRKAAEAAAARAWLERQA